MTTAMTCRQFAELVPRLLDEEIEMSAGMRAHIVRSSSPSRLSQSSSPAASIRSNVAPSTRGAPRLARARSYAWRRMSARQTSS